MKVSFQNKIFFLFIIISIIVISTGIATYRTTDSLLKSHDLVTHTHEVIEELGMIMSNALDLQIGTRGFIITNDTSFLKPYIEGKNDINKNLNKLEILISDNTTKFNRIDSLKALVEKKIAISERLIDTRSKLGFIEAKKIVDSGEGKYLTKEIRKVVNMMMLVQTSLLKISQSNNLKESRALINSVIILLIAILLTLFFVFILIRHNIILRNKTEEKLNFSLNEISNFKTLFEEAPGLYVILLPDFTVEAVSNEYLKATRTFRKEILGKDMFVAFPEKFNELNINNDLNLKESLNLVLKNKIAHKMDIQKYTIKNADGTFEVRYLSPLNKPILDENKNIVYLIHSIEDITTQIQHEKEMFDASEEIKDLYNKAPCGYLSVDSSIFLTNINQTLLNWLGYSVEEVIGKMKYEDLLSQKSKEIHLNSFIEDYDKFIELGYVNDLEFEFQRKDKTTFPAVVNSAATLNEKGEFVKSHTTVFDNTERKKIENKIQENIKEISDYKFALNESAIVAITNKNGTIKYVNDNFCRVSKYKRDELIGQDHRILNSGFHSKEFIAKLWETILNGKLWKGEIRNKAKDGSFYWVDTTIIPFLNENGKPFQFISVRFDITEQKYQQELLLSQAKELNAQQEKLKESNSILEIQANKLQASEEELKAQQEELMQSNQELEEKTQLLEEKNHSVNEKNEELESASFELQQKAEELALSSKYKSEFLANMSHELRTPLNSILLLSKLLSDNLEGNLSNEQKEFASVINNSGNNLLQLINEILDLSKIESGKMNIDIERVDLNTILNNVNNTFTQLAKEKGIQFSSKISGNLPEYLKTDIARVEQVLNNFLSNAFKFTKNGSVELIIRPTNEFESKKMAIKPKNFISFEVIDSGIGISIDKHDLVFEAFQQADGSTRRKYGGTGLGLAISREIAHLLGGEIQLKSELEKGSSFTLVIPLDCSQTKLGLETIFEKDNSNFIINKNPILYSSSIDNDVVEFTPDEIADDRNIIFENDKVILIVEDDTAFAQALVKYIHERGYKAIVAVSGADALLFAIKYKPIGILLDIQLPVKSGWTVLKELKKNNEVKYIPVHMMSSLQTKAKESISLGAIDFINKPFADNELNLVFDKIESVSGKLPKIILLINDNENHILAVSNFIGNTFKKCLTASSVKEASEILRTKDVDCIVLDIEMQNELAYNVLETIKNDVKLEKIPVIIYTGRAMSLSEEKKIKQFANEIIIKTADSFKRLSSGISYFLHLVESNDEKKTLKLPYISDKALLEKHILIVDDDVRNIFSLTKLLESQKINVSSAGDGNEALEILKNKNDIDLILMDMMMPNKDGYETIMEIRNDDELKKIPIIAVTAKAMLGDREKCIKIGANDYVTKPVDGDRLLSLLRVLLYNK